MKVLIKKFDDDNVVKEVDCKTTNRRQAEKIERGMNINLNHDDYYTEIVE